MKWITVFSILFCAANFVMGFTVLATISYNMIMTTTKEDRFPIKVMTYWREYLTQLIPVMIYIITVSVVTCWAVSRRRKPCTAGAILTLHIISLCLCCLYCGLIHSLIGAAEIQPEELKEKTLELFRTNSDKPGGDSRWVPVWLIEVQSQSDTCCGILSYQDWNDFWPLHRDEVPMSCCQEETNCVTNLAKIEWPAIPSTYIKNDEGCAREVSQTVERRIFEAVKFLIILIVFLILSIVALLFQYTAEYCLIPGTNSEGAPSPRNISNLTVGETWARMGFGKSQRKKEQKSRRKFEDLEPLQICTEPGSYADVFLQNLDFSSSTNNTVSSPNLKLADNFVKGSVLNKESVTAEINNNNYSASPSNKRVTRTLSSSKRQEDKRRVLENGDIVNLLNTDILVNNYTSNKR